MPRPQDHGYHLADDRIAALIAGAIDPPEPELEPDPERQLPSRQLAGDEPAEKPGPVHRVPRDAPHPYARPAQVPGALRGARMQVAPRALLGVLVLLVVVAAVVGVRVWLARSAAEPVAQTLAGGAPAATSTGVAGSGSGVGSVTGAPTAVDPAGTASITAPVLPGAGDARGSASTGPAAFGPSAANGAASGSADAAAGGDLVVHVAGEVKKPGVVRLAAGSRVGDAVRRRGGLTPAADPTSVNLARPIVDGEQILVLRRGQPRPPAPPAAPARGSSGAGSGSSGSGGVGAGAVIDLNTADTAALETLPGVGPKTAQKIIDWRTRNGRFGSVDELAEIDGIGPKTLERLRPLVRV